MNILDDGAIDLPGTVSCIDALNDDCLLTFLGDLLNDNEDRSDYHNPDTADLAIPQLTREHFDTLPFQKIPSNLFDLVLVDRPNEQQESRLNLGVVGSQAENAQEVMYVRIKAEDIAVICEKMSHGTTIIPIRRSTLNRPNFTMNIHKIPRRRQPHNRKNTVF